ncbi:hypothetical protein [Nocardia abscessus]|uniref:hypothetical protein n=1 Tax=Nocardia abscessus TaxID=120957 RepID=UPI00146149D2|nr:hypothetical protein [Nocardia abscessus]
MTGAILWTKVDLAEDFPGKPLAARIGETSFRYTSGYLTVAAGAHTARYDARTGKQLWLTDLSSVRCARPRESALTITDNAIYRAFACQQGNETWVVATALDPQTGAITRVRKLAQVNGAAGASVSIKRLANTVVVDWYFVKAEGGGRVVLRKPEQLDTAAVVEDDDDATLIGADPHSSDVLEETFGPHAVWVKNIDNMAIRYQVPDAWGSSIQPSNAFLGAELVETGWDQERIIVRSWNRADGLPSAVRRATTDDRCRAQWLLPAPGALLVLCHGDTRTEIIGFGSCMPRSSSLAFWPFGLLAFWPFGLLAFWPFGLLAFWPFGLLAFWPCKAGKLRRDRHRRIVMCASPSPNRGSDPIHGPTVVPARVTRGRGTPRR